MLVSVSSFDGIQFFVTSVHMFFATGWRDGGMAGWRDGGMAGWNEGIQRKTNREVFFFLSFKEKKKGCHRCHCPAILLESQILILLNFFLTIIPSV